MSNAQDNRAVCPACGAENSLAVKVERHDGYDSPQFSCSQCSRVLYIGDDPPPLPKLLKWAAQAWAYPEEKCPTCPPEPMKERRSRCPICQEWITYTPDHPGHRYFSGVTGRWTKSSFKPVQLAWMGHMNANAETHKGKPFVNALYEKAGD